MLQTHTSRVSGTGGRGQRDQLRRGRRIDVADQSARCLAADLAKDGWTFRGGAVRGVGSHRWRSSYFTKGKAAVSVFSLPAEAAPEAKDGMTYDRNYHDAPIAGFVKGKGLYCIVGSSEDGSLTVDEVKRLLEAHRGDVKG